jgi:hypothetical protein
VFEKLAGEYTSQAPEVAFRRLQHECYAQPYYGRAMVFLREYILGSQTPEKLKQMKYSARERRFLLPKDDQHPENVYTAAYGEWRTYFLITNQLLTPQESCWAKTWAGVWQDTAGAIWDELYNKHADKRDSPWNIPRPEAPPGLYALDTDEVTWSEIRACFAETES